MLCLASLSTLIGEAGTSSEDITSQVLLYAISFFGASILSFGEPFSLSDPASLLTLTGEAGTSEKLLKEDPEDESESVEEEELVSLYFSCCFLCERTGLVSLLQPCCFLCGSLPLVFQIQARALFTPLLLYRPFLQHLPLHLAHLSLQLRWKQNMTHFGGTFLRGQFLIRHILNNNRTPHR